MRVQLFVLLSLSLSAAERVTATGAVIDEITRQPIPNATVLVHSAGVKTGYDLFCPTCYIDCGKRATTSANGRFSIPNLSPDLKFNLLIVREGYTSAFTGRLDPTTGPAPEVALRLRAPVANPLQTGRGRVLDARGQPVREALVSQRGIIFEAGRGFGDRGWLDLIAVSNADGDFELAYSKPAKAMIVEVAPRGMAPKLVTLSTGESRQPVTVTDGATIRGRLVHNGKPIANAEFALVTHSNSSGKMFQEVRIGTNAAGEFAITNVPAGRVWDLVPKMDSLAPRGLAAPVTSVATADDGQEIHTGDILAVPAFTLKGRIVLQNGAPIPPGMRLSLSADRVPDRQTVELPPGGDFVFRGLAKAVYSLFPAVKGYQLPDPEQPLELLATGDRSNLRIVMVPEKPSAPRP